MVMGQVVDSENWGCFSDRLESREVCDQCFSGRAQGQRTDVYQPELLSLELAAQQSSGRILILYNLLGYTLLREGKGITAGML